LFVLLQLRNFRDLPATRHELNAIEQAVRDNGYEFVVVDFIQNVFVQPRHIRRRLSVASANPRRQIYYAMKRHTKRLLAVTDKLIEAIELDTELFVQERPFLLPEHERKQVENLTQQQRASRQTISRLTEEIEKLL
jgi:hypothetical protein